MSAVDYKATIRLPNTGFPMRGNLAQREPDAVAHWREIGLYERLLAQRADAPRFVFHDGPPYANGDIHHGHALNKTLKDIVVKFRLMSGYHTTHVPGWDCHGLPIELKVDKELGKAKRDLSTVEFRTKCREYADRWVKTQSDSFERLLVLADFDRPYRTMDYDYEASIVRVLGELMDGGFLFKGLKPVHWSWSAVTSLAEAEVEYDRYVAPSVYVQFAFEAPPAWLAEKAGGRAVDVVIWTTTPWTLPSNLAIVLNPALDYQLLALDDERAIILAEGLKAEVFEKCGLDDLEVLHTFAGRELVGEVDDRDPPRPTTRHPFIDRDSVLLPADYVTLEQGTGCVHTAPGHGADDFNTGRKYGIGVVAPVDRYGKYTSEVPDYEGMHVFKANPLIAQRLADTGRLLNQPGDTYVVDRYPHCWRTKKPLIFRATEQWFVGVDHAELRQNALQAIRDTEWVPHWGENRIRGMMETRPDWNISRQRVWGVPITAFECGACHEHVVDGAVARHVAAMVETEGCDVWWTHAPQDLVPDGYACPHCGAAADGFQKVDDILDVWFDSGVSWAAVMRDREGQGGQADLYLEGSDQHRGWFHTSLLTSVATQGHAPYKTVLTHGFVVDDKGAKYSKSSPNFEPLSKMLDVYGADILRLWVAMVDYRSDMTLSPANLKQAAGAYRKIRNTLRFLLGNLSDFSLDAVPSVRAEVTTVTDAPAAIELTDLDRWALSRTAEFVDRVREAYLAYEFHGVFHATLEFCNEHLSTVYLDALKDRMYCDAEGDPRRRGAQFVMYEAARALAQAIAPVLSFTANEAWGYLRDEARDPETVFEAGFPEVPDAWSDAAVDATLAWKLALRSRVSEQIEARRPKKKGEREPGQIGSSQEAVVTLTATGDALARLQAAKDALTELLIVSRIDLVDGAAADESGVDVAVAPSEAARCPRCWNARADIGTNAEWPDLCGRCASVVSVLDLSGSAGE